MKRGFAIISIAIFVCACTKREMPVSQTTDMKVLREKLAFSCVHEDAHLPKLDADADKLFVYGRYLQAQDGPKDFDDIIRYYRIAAAHDHYKANQNAQMLIVQGLAVSPTGPKEAADLAMQLVQQGIPGGYYDVGHYLEIGYGLKQDASAAMKYIRKAADLGNSDAQAYVADKLNPIEMAPDIARKMWQCAAEQGNGSAAYDLGVALAVEHRFSEAASAFQRGVQAGDTQSAYSLEQAFKGPSPSDRVNYLGLDKDEERSRRYRRIGEFIDNNAGRNPRVPEVDKIVPLPPASLPAWDGTFQWEKEQAATKPPEKPSEELIDRLAKEKHLDPATGLPLAGASAKTSANEEAHTEAVAEQPARLPLGSVALTGDKCPEDGVWCANLGTRHPDNAERRFTKGETLPPLTIQAPRQIALLDRWIGAREHTQNVVWELVAYTRQG